jgi:hypothetical protein
MHGRPSQPRLFGPTSGPGRGRNTGQTGPDRTGPGRRTAPGLALAKARRRAHALHRGRARARHRIEAGHYALHPGWRGRIPAEFELVTDQARALRRIAEAVDAELWSPRQRSEWGAMLEHMVHATDWDGMPIRPGKPRDPGAVKGMTRRRLSKLVGRSERTVSRMWAWAEDAGLLVRVEQGAPADWLETEHNRAAAWAWVAPKSIEQAPSPQCTSAQVTGAVDGNGNHPQVSVGNYPLRNAERLDSTRNRRERRPADWPLFGIPATPSERETAAGLLLARAGLDPRGVDKRRIRGLLKPWFEAGVCPAELLWAIDHHPDRPAHSRGGALRGAQDPVAVLGHRLAPWQGRLTELPNSLAGHRGDYRTVQAERVAEKVALATRRPEVVHQPTSVERRAAERAFIDRHMAVQRARRLPTSRLPVMQAVGRWKPLNGPAGRS